MTKSSTSADRWTEERVRAAFEDAGLPPVSVARRDFPEETIFLVSVTEDQFEAAVGIGNRLDATLETDDFQGFVTVRSVKSPAKSAPAKVVGRVNGVHDLRAAEFIQLLTSRARTSDALPSLHYIRDSSANIAAAIAPRHHLIFGRRGVGKTALLLEAKRQVLEKGSLASWTNVQVLRRETPERILLYVLESILEAVLVDARRSLSSARTTTQVSQVYDEVARFLNKDKLVRRDVDRLIPSVQKALRRYLDTTGTRLFIFVDDFYFVPRTSQPDVLDYLHGCVRDCDAWLKIASIQYLTRWFVSSPPTGLQTGQDADIVNLDVTLQDPPRAKKFLESILMRYAEAASIPRLTSVLRGEALDRLVLACGGVPRDYLVLAAGAISKAQRRPSSRLAGVQDVNEAAGDAAQAKTMELEEDLSTEVGEAQLTLRGLESLRKYCLDEVECTYFRVDFRQREELPDEYGLLVSLSELRLVHMINVSLSDSHRAGEKYEVYMLDLSQFSASRLKQAVEVLDLVGGAIISKRTGKAGSERRGGSPRQLNAILRAAPVLDLGRFSPMLAVGSSR